MKNMFTGRHISDKVDRVIWKKTLGGHDMDDYNLKRIADALEEIAREMKFRRETDHQDFGFVGLKVDALTEEISAIKQHMTGIH